MPPMHLDSTLGAARTLAIVGKNALPLRLAAVALNRFERVALPLRAQVDARRRFLLGSLDTLALGTLGVQNRF